MARKLQADKWLFASVIGLSLFGIVMVYSASAVIAQGEHHGQYFYVMKQAIWTFIGLGVMVAATQFDYQRLRNRRLVYGLLGVTVLMLVAVFAFPRINGAHRWIRMGGASMQPSEAAKLSFAIFLAYFLEKRAGDETSFWRTLIPCLFVLGVLAALILKEPDLGTALMLVIVCFGVCYAAGVRVAHLAIISMPVLFVTICMLIFSPFRRGRIITYMDPWADQLGKGYQVVQSLISIGSGGPHGLGFAQGRQKMFFLPFAHSDFIFAVVGEELGLLGGLVVVLVFALFLWRGMRAALRAPDRFGMLLGLGLVVGIVAQALFNISVAIALLPAKGIPLPFISYGGSSLVPTLAAAGLLLNISQYANLTNDPALLRSNKKAAPQGRAAANRNFPAGLRLPASARQG
ncbi:MAG: cell division protein FtsW [Blastocatellia bacterium]|jgi:cell division protein FtsW|nr:cell division protein FtsW [Blastocatellia bacterium]